MNRKTIPMKHPRRTAATIFAALLVATGVPHAATGGIDDAAADFSSSANPQGPWRYGWMPRDGGTFTLAGQYPTSGGIDRYEGGGQSFVGHNGTRRHQSFGTGSWPPGLLALHPGREGEVAVVRWTAARTGTVIVDAHYTRRDPVYPTTTDVRVRRRGVDVFSAELDGQRSQARFRSLVSVSEGDTLDFAVGWGRNRNYHGDTTGLALRIRWVESPADEPSVYPR